MNSVTGSFRPSDRPLSSSPSPNSKVSSHPCSLAVIHSSSSIAKERLKPLVPVKIRQVEDQTEKKIENKIAEDFSKLDKLARQHDVEWRLIDDKRGFQEFVLDNLIFGQEKIETGIESLESHIANFFPEKIAEEMESSFGKIEEAFSNTGLLLSGIDLTSRLLALKHKSQILERYTKILESIKKIIGSD